LRDAGHLTLSMVALFGDEVAGHIAFSPVTIAGLLSAGDLDRLRFCRSIRCAASEVSS
jgi:predicted N-acetyltransferase YhbS